MRRPALLRNVLCYVSFPETSLPSCGQPGSSKPSAPLPAQEPEVPMFSSLGFAVGLAFAVGITIVLTLVAKAGPDKTIARVLYDAERPEKTL